MDKKTLILIIIFLYVFVKGVIIEPNSLEVVKYQLQDSELKGIKIAFLTDFHLKRNDYKRLDKIINLTNEQKPDVVLLGGDFAKGQNIKNTMNPDLLAQKLKFLNAPTYGVLGNHDWWSDGIGFFEAFKRNNIKILENSSMRIILNGKYVDIIGFADYTTRTVNMSKAFIKTNNPRIVISHNPDVYFDILNTVNLILAGHTHGGQVVLPFIKATIVPSKYGSSFANGLVEKTKNKMIISKGLGTSILPIRYNCKPEITIVEFI